MLILALVVLFWYAMARLLGRTKIKSVAVNTFLIVSLFLLMISSAVSIPFIFGASHLMAKTEKMTTTQLMALPDGNGIFLRKEVMRGDTTIFYSSPTGIHTKRYGTDVLIFQTDEGIPRLEEKWTELSSGLWIAFFYEDPEYHFFVPVGGSCW